MKKLQFEVSSGLKSIIGQDLITNDIVAIFELVKNSYDAGSNRVDIIFETKLEKIIVDNQHVEIPYKERIFIVDDGKGMSYLDIVNKWLRVAYSAKKDGTEDHLNKAYAGNKGVGRFSCDRLGANLRIQSKSKSCKHVSNIYVNWGDFDKDFKQDFSSIDILYEEKSKFDTPDDKFQDLTSGVIIEISDLREAYSWTTKKLINLKRSLIKLVDPFGDSDNDFEIYIDDKFSLKEDDAELKKISNNVNNEEISSNIVNGKVSNSIIELLKEKTTCLYVELDNGYYYSTLTDRGELVYKIKEPIEKHSFLLDSSFKCELFFLNRSAKNTFTRRMGTPSVNYGSLFLFRNGFRVFPIGEEDNDFWGLNRRKQQGHSRYLGSRDILGKVDVWGDESKFKEASSRDMGLIKTDASEELKKVILNKVVKKLEAYVVNIQWKDVFDKDYDTSERMHRDENKLKILDLVSKLSGSSEIELLNYNTELVAIYDEKSKHFETTIDKIIDLADDTNNTELLKLVKEATTRFEVEQKRALEAKRQADREQELRREAERKAKSEAIRRSEEEIKRRQAEEQAEKFKVESQQEKSRNLFLSSMEVDRDKEKLESFIHQLIIYSAATKDLINIAINKVNRSNGPLDKKEILDTFSDILNNNEKIITTSRFAILADFMLDSACIEENLASYISQYMSEIVTAYNQKIKIETNIPNDLDFVIRFSPIEVGLVFDNLIANSQKARASKVSVDAVIDKNKHLVITITDNGRGLAKGVDPARIFEKGYTSTNGSGLGLHHSKSQVEKIGGEIFVDEEQPKRGARFIIRIKK
ncbi:ATP-binding protein [Vibrio cyclitrophicus]|uniref:ATP-binding protein n=1 Tax=Vibrio cyclitrophicus TaxID=47951 RepID=UPI0020622BB9|nr:ATP-binding protein [Vibrio cyclitrophicus]UPR26398.1 ATP-binding protein [Vibrio cyclitrophicus]